jgi:hypothetical protein
VWVNPRRESIGRSLRDQGVDNPAISDLMIFDL